jgi:hypothetical protein
MKSGFLMIVPIYAKVSFKTEKCRIAPEVTTPESTPKTTPGCTSETTSKTTVEVTLEVTLEGGTLNVGITVEAALEVASRVQTWFWGAQDSIDLPVM